MSMEEKISRIGVMGGTFNPIHYGHLVTAEEALSQFKLDKVMFMPAGVPPHKSDREILLPEERYLLTVIATASNPDFVVSRLEIERKGPSYTIDTLAQLQQIFGPDTTVFFITGADALEKILTWRGWEEMFELATFVGVSRPGFELSDTHLAQIGDGRVHLLEIPALAISSTECRRRAAEDAPVWYLVPDGVVQYIAKRNLYRPEGSTRLDGTPAATAPAHRELVPTDHHTEENHQ
jgi:nicotinate-nucleotide adenylyltransferase